MRASYWMAIASVIATAFTALPTLTSAVAHALNAALLVMIVLTARHEGRHP